MSLRLDRIRVRRAGPLDRDFELSPGDLNLIYGANESGKTYVVESLIRFLFKTSRGAPVKWDLRDLDVDGSVLVSGLEAEPLRFSKTEKKLEDYWEETSGLPLHLSRLLVVRAGETLIANPDRENLPEDGVGRDILKDYLSGEGTLDRIGAPISITIKSPNTKVEERWIDGEKELWIDGKNVGELKSMRICEKEADKHRRLLADVEDGYTSGEAGRLREKESALKKEVERLRNAKRYQANQLAVRRKKLKGEERSLPKDLGRVEGEGEEWEKALEELEERNRNLAEHDESQREPMAKPELVCGLAGILIGLVIVVVDPREYGLLLGVLMILGSIVCILLRMRHLIRKKEVERSDLMENRDRYADEVSERKQALEQSLNKWVEEKLSAKEWRSTLERFKEERMSLDGEINLVDRDLIRLGVPEREYLDDRPKEEWDQAAYDELESRLQKVRDERGEAEDQLRALKNRAIQATGLDDDDWTLLITSLRKLTEESTDEYKKWTAKVLAEMQLNKALNEYREEENKRIADGLARDELTEPLYALTGRYQNIRLEEERGLVLISDQDEEYPLSDLSTGAREQIFFALRTGFARVGTDGSPKFLILDDAFQHSDTQRRGKLVEQALTLVQDGWQIFYFTMDDHIRKLFRDAGKRLEKLDKKYKFVEGALPDRNVEGA